MNALELLSQLRAAGIELRPKEGKLLVNAPSGVLTVPLREKIAAHKTDLLALITDPGNDDAPIAILPRDRPLPVSHFQERLWLLQQLDPDATEYNLVTVWQMEAGYSTSRLVEAMRAVLRRHEILRLGFIRAESHLQAVPFAPDAVQIDIEDISSRSPDQQRNHMQAEVSRQTARPFDLANEPPFRCIVYAIGMDRCALLIAAHHIAVDHWSLSLLRQELVRSLEDRTYAEDPPSIQYADYADWSRDASRMVSMEGSLSWWADYLKSPPELSAFDADMSPQMRGTGASVSFVWDEELSSGLSAFARSEHSSVYMCLVATCAALLNRYTGQEDILIGSAMGARQRSEFESIIGPFVNSITYRMEVDPTKSFRTLLDRARESILETSSRADVPFESVIERVQPVRKLNRSPLFQTAVVMQNAWDGQADAIHGGGAIHDLTWFVRPLNGSFVGSIEYRSDIYSEQTIKGILLRLEAFVRAAIAEPDRMISALPVYVEGERQFLIDQFNPAHRDYDHTPISTQIGWIAAGAPDRAAVRFDDKITTYGELDVRSNRLAHLLIQMGIGRGDIVGVCTDRTPDLLVAIIGVHRAGAAYLPLDPDFPNERIKYQLADSGARMLVTQAVFANKFDLSEGIHVVDIDMDGDVLAGMPGTAPDLEITPDDTSHLIYTSGSTGRPKGVIIRHGSVSNIFASMGIEPGIKRNDIVAATTTASFDIAAIELLLPLTIGARVELLSRAIATNGHALATALSAIGATVVQATPSAWRMLVEADWEGGTEVLAITGGEPLTRDLADRLLTRVGALWNGYGPTETTIYSSGCFIKPDGAAISIGRPIANTRIYVLDANDEIAPVGMRGEICIAGEGVSSGYHGMLSETESRFSPDTFASMTDGSGAEPRYYKTGDIGRWSSDGNLYYLGRSDHQVKIRGMRIELGEIESVLAAHKAIRQAIVVVGEAGKDDLRLVAYVIFEPGHELTVSETRRIARDRLPNYMVPSIIVELVSIPKTPNGKLDRKALPDPYNQAMQRHERVPLEPGLESALANIWAELLRTNDIGAEDNFFDLGGHSLLTLQVATKVEDHLGLHLDPRLMFFQNLRQIASQLKRNAEDQE